MNKTVIVVSQFMDRDNSAIMRRPGDEIQMDNERAARLIARGFVKAKKVSGGKNSDGDGKADGDKSK